ncbi:hypothetical protein OG426_19470 [Streptomyces canus]|uniref:hypothetical protein n=1 Tax=Streptomyces canus TaxID=58343 RepID=UPI003866CF88|nr:hypothetical protein OG426_19470 [Streptomyces canus]
MTHLNLVTTSRFKPGDMVLIPAAPALAADEPDITTLGIVTPNGAHSMCVTCHCTPTNLDHQGDASLCCPGPHYFVRFGCPHPCQSGAAHEHVMTYAAHEITRRRHLASV